MFQNLYHDYMNYKKIARDKTLKQTTEIVKLSTSAKNVVDLSIGQPDFGPPRGILKQEASKYGPIQGNPELRKLIAKKLRKENKIKTTPKNIIITCGSIEAIMLSLLSTVERGVEVLTPNPGFMTYDDSIWLTGAKSVYYYFDGCRLDINDIKKRITKKTKAIILNSPGNPMGNVFSREEIKSLVELLKRKNIWIISDEVYEKFAYDKPHISIGSYEEVKDRVITTISFSKSYSIPGWRIGYANVPSKLITSMVNMKMICSIGTTSVSQLAAIKLLKKGNSIISKNIKPFKKRRDCIVKEIGDNIQCYSPEGAFYMWVDLRYLKKKSMLIFKDLLKEGLLTIPGSVFGTMGEGFIRLSYANKESEIRNGMKILKKYLKTKRF